MGGGRRQDQALVRIASMLLALAVLAESAAGRAFPVRWFVLTLLAQGEAVARSFVVEQIGDAWLCLDQAGDLAHERPRWDALAAMHLAVRFRVLATVLSACLHADGGAGHPGGNLLPVDGGRIDDAPAPHLVLVVLVCGARRRLDTS